MSAHPTRSGAFSDRDARSAFSADQLRPIQPPVLLTQLPPAQPKPALALDSNCLVNLHFSAAAQALIQVLLIDLDQLGQLMTFGGGDFIHGAYSSVSLDLWSSEAHWRKDGVLLEHPHVPPHPRDYPPSDDPLVQALQRLLRSRGGVQAKAHIAVADEAKLNDQSLYQIAFGVKDSKTGSPKLPGPKIRNALSVAFPGWMEFRGLESRHLEPVTSIRAGRRAVTLNDALEVISAELAAVPLGMRASIAQNLAGWANDGGAKHWHAAITALFAQGKRQLPAA